MDRAGRAPDRDFAVRLDAADLLRHYRDAFEIADPELIYMDGNSLDRLPRRTAQLLERVINEEWGDDLIRGWGASWFEAPQQIGDRVAKLLGARSHEVIISDSTSVNLFKLVVAALRARPSKRGATRPTHRSARPSERTARVRTTYRREAGNEPVHRRPGAMCDV